MSLFRLLDALQSSTKCAAKPDTAPEGKHAVKLLVRNQQISDFVQPPSKGLLNSFSATVDSCDTAIFIS